MMMSHDQLIEQGLCDLLILQSFDEIANGTRSRVLRKDKAKRVAALNKAIAARPQSRLAETHQTRILLAAR
jgi:hypothetical protein